MISNKEVILLLNHAHHHSSLTSENSSVSQLVEFDNLFGIVMYVAATYSVAILTYLDNKRTPQIFYFKFYFQCTKIKLYMSGHSV